MEENRITEIREPEALVRADHAVARESLVLEVPPEDVPHLLDYWELILKRRWLVLTCVLVVFTTVALGTLKEQPVYEGKVEIEIDPEPPSVVNFKEVVSVGNNGDFESYQDTQYKLIKSRTLAEQVVKDLKLYESPEFIRPRYLFGLIEGAVPALPPNIDEDPPDASSPLFKNAVAYLKSAVDVDPVRRSNLADITVDAHDPNLAATVANKLADDYANFNLETKYNETMKASAWLKNKIADMKIAVEKEDDKLAEYARANGIVFVNDKETLVTAHLSQVANSLTAAQNDLIAVGTLYEQVQAGHIETLPGIIDNPLVQDLRRRKDDLERQYEDLSVEYKPDYPKVKVVKKELDAIDQQIEQQKKTAAKTITDQYDNARERVKKFNDALNEAKREQNDLAEKTIQYDIIKREASSNHELYDGLLTRMKEANVSAGLGASNIRVIDPAIVPGGPVKPRVLLNLSLGLIAGLGLGIGLAFFQEYLDKTLKTPDDVEQYLRLPSLGVVPRFTIAGAKDGKGEEALLASGSNGHHALAPGIKTDPQSVEAFRSLRTSVLLSASPVPRLILVTSALPSEGKTTTTVNLGATLASLGNRVVVVDCDMRRPSCHRSTGVENAPGFVQCLTGHVDLKAAVLPVQGVENLSVIPCGPIPPNPAEVLSAPLTADLLRRLRTQFEYVLVDSPPLLSVADSRILATLVDAVVLVARAHATPYDVVRRARTLLYGSGARILGVALNDVDLERGFGSQHYQYGYGYDYGSEPQDVNGSRDRA
jgi:polysaccharide biosynthesis transport protein